MGVYSDIDLKEINEILAFYHFAKAKSFTATTEGISNSNYRVVLENEDEILLKVSNDKNIEQLENEQRILHVLKKHQYPYSPGAFETLDGGLVYRHKDYYGVIFPFIKGAAPVINTDTCEKIGQALAQLHSLEIDREDLETVRPYDHVGYGGMHIFDYTLELNAAPDFVSAFTKVFPDKLQDIPYDLFPAGIIHGDLYFDNCLFHNGELATLLDFEQAGRGRFILDIGIAISGGCLTSDKSDIDDELVASFIAGYEKSRSLITLEKEYLDTAILVGFFSIALWRIKRFYSGRLDESRKYNYQELLARALKYHGRVKL